MIRPLRIAMATEYAYPVLGGISEHVHFLSRELAQLGHDVTVVTSHAPRGTRPAADIIDADHRAQSGYRTVRIGHSIPLPSNGSIARVSVGRALKRRLGRVQAPMDVVHSQGLAAPFFPLWSLRASKAPCTVGTFHTYFDGGHIAYRTLHTYLATALGNADRKIAVSEACVMSTGQYFPDEHVRHRSRTGSTRSSSPRSSGPPSVCPARQGSCLWGASIRATAWGRCWMPPRILKLRGYDFEVQVVRDGRPGRCTSTTPARGSRIRVRSLACSTRAPTGSDGPGGPRPGLVRGDPPGGVRRAPSSARQHRVPAGHPRWRRRVRTATTGGAWPTGSVSTTPCARTGAARARDRRTAVRVADRRAPDQEIFVEVLDKGIDLRVAAGRGGLIVRSPRDLPCPNVADVEYDPPVGTATAASVGHDHYEPQGMCWTVTFIAHARAATTSPRRR